MDAIVADRHNRLCAYQNRSYANKCKDFITTIRNQEKSLREKHPAIKDSQGEGESEPFTAAVSRNL